MRNILTTRLKEVRVEKEEDEERKNERYDSSFAVLCGVHA